MATDDGAGRAKKTLWSPELALPTIALLALPFLILAEAGGEALDGFGLVGAGFYALLLVIALRLLRCRVTLTKDEIVQHTFIGRRHTPARHVTAVKLRQPSTHSSPPYPALHLKDGSIVGLAYAGGYLIGGWKNAAAIRDFYDHVADPAQIAKQR